MKHLKLLSYDVLEEKGKEKENNAAATAATTIFFHRKDTIWYTENKRKRKKRLDFYFILFMFWGKFSKFQVSIDIYILAVCAVTLIFCTKIKFWSFFLVPPTSSKKASF